MSDDLASDRRTGSLEGRWRQVLETAPESYVAVDGDGVIRDWNRGASRLLGLEKVDAVSTPMARFVPAPHQQRLTHELRQAVLQPQDDYRAPLQLELRTYPGTEFPAECQVWGVDRREGTLVHCFLRDVTDQRRAQANAALLSAVVAGSADAIVTEDRLGGVVTWNAAAERMFDWTADQMIGSPVLVIVPEDEVGEHKRLVAEVFRGEPVRRVESNWVSRSGVKIPVALRMSPVCDANGDTVAVSTVARDITEQRWMAATLDATLLQLQVALSEAQSSEEGSRRFLADAAHQLRTPLSGIRACAELLLLGAPDADRDRLLATMVRETSRSGRLITALLHVARLDQGRALPRGEVDLAQLCQDEVEKLSLLAPDLVVTLEASDAPTGTLPLDAGSCQEILSNLADNARRHARSEVTFTVTCDGEKALVRVSDDGLGVADDDRSRIFERFVSLDGRGGSGLGLPIARGLAKALGGELCYADGFVLELPLTTPSD